MKSIIISGNAMTGKTELAKLISKGFKYTYFVTEGYFPGDINPNCECLIFEEIPSNIESYNFIKRTSKQENITFRKPYQSNASRITPDLLIFVVQGIFEVTNEYGIWHYKLS